jgi:hypothetical protein
MQNLNDPHTGLPDSGLIADATLEAEIDAAWDRMKKKTASDRESQDSLTEVQVLMRRRSDTQWMKLEFQRRALMGNQA